MALISKHLFYARLQHTEIFTAITVVVVFVACQLGEKKCKNMQ
jgi:hypothetical protein